MLFRSKIFWQFSNKDEEIAFKDSKMHYYEFHLNFGVCAIVLFALNDFRAMATTSYRTFDPKIVGNWIGSIVRDPPLRGPPEEFLYTFI